MSKFLDDGDGLFFVEDGRVLEAAIDDAALDAATHPDNDLPEPTQAQKESGNYKKAHVRLCGLDIAIENPAGSSRSGVDKGGKTWSVTMKSHYGYVKGSVGRDKDPVDVFVKPGTTDKVAAYCPVFVVDQVLGGKFDEHKILIGFDTEAEATAAYMENYDAGWPGMGAISGMSMTAFKLWVTDPKETKQPVAWEPGDEPILESNGGGNIPHTISHIPSKYLLKMASEISTDESPYGFCPICGEKGVTRERRRNGDTTCRNGHQDPSKMSLPSAPILESASPGWRERIMAATTWEELSSAFLAAVGSTPKPLAEMTNAEYRRMVYDAAIAAIKAGKTVIISTHTKARQVSPETLSFSEKRGKILHYEGKTAGWVDVEFEALDSLANSLKIPTSWDHSQAVYATNPDDEYDPTEDEKPSLTMEQMDFSIGIYLDVPEKQAIKSLTAANVADVIQNAVEEPYRELLASYVRGERPDLMSGIDAAMQTPVDGIIVSGQKEPTGINSGGSDMDGYAQIDAKTMARIVEKKLAKKLYLRGFMSSLKHEGPGDFYCSGKVDVIRVYPSAGTAQVGYWYTNKFGEEYTRRRVKVADILILEKDAPQPAATVPNGMTVENDGEDIYFRGNGRWTKTAKGGKGWTVASGFEGETKAFKVQKWPTKQAALGSAEFWILDGKQQPEKADPFPAEDDTPRQGDIYRREDGKIVVVMRVLPGGKYEVRISGGGRTLLATVKKESFSRMTKTGRAEYKDGAFVNLPEQPIYNVSETISFRSSR